MVAGLNKRPGQSIHWGEPGPRSVVRTPTERAVFIPSPDLFITRSEGIECR